MFAGAQDKLILETLHRFSLLSFRVNVNNIKENIPLFCWKGLKFKALQDEAAMGWTLPNGLVRLLSFPWALAKEDNRTRGGGAGGGHLVLEAAACFCTCGFKKWLV